MPLETGTHIADLVATNPISNDAVGQGDDHLRLIKSVLQATLPNFGGAFGRVNAVTAGRTVLSTDNTTIMQIPAGGATLSHTFSLPALSSITAGFYFDIYTQGRDDLATLVPTGGATIEGQAQLILGPQVHARVFYNGTNWRVQAAVPVQATTGNAKINGALSISGAATLNSTLTVSGAAVLQSTLNILGGATLSSTLTVSGAVTMASTLSVSGVATFKSAVSCSAGATIGGNLTVSGAAVFGGGVTVGGTLTTSGAVVVGGTVTVLGGQVAFPATQNASADANTLDDYEEGTWTPTLTFATAGNLVVVYSQRLGYYTKIGRAVTVQVRVQTSTFTHTTASGNSQITGLPFTPIDVISVGALAWTGVTKAIADIVWTLDAASTTTRFLTSASASALGTVTASDMPTGGTVEYIGTADFHTT